MVLYRYSIDTTVYIPHTQKSEVSKHHEETYHRTKAGDAENKIYLELEAMPRINQKRKNIRLQKTKERTNDNNANVTRTKQKHLQRHISARHNKQNT